MDSLQYLNASLTLAQPERYGMSEERAWLFHSHPCVNHRIFISAGNVSAETIDKQHTVSLQRVSSLHCQMAAKIRLCSKKKKRRVGAKAP